MTDLHQKERAIFLEAIELSDEAERAACLDRACGNDTELRQRVRQLLEAHEASQARLQPLGFCPNSEDFGVAPSETATHSTAALDKISDQIDRYTLLHQIGEGGFGVVYMAEQEQPVRRTVALKIIKPGMDTKGVIARFEAERQALALMDHPNVAKVLDAGATESGRPFFVMELVDGVPITEFCDTQRLSTRERLELFGDVCRAVQHAHQKGIIHRDLKPTNVMVALHDDKPVVKVIDFGVSKALNQQLTANSVYTAYGQTVGTPLYMAPEQTQIGMRDVDTRSDIYSLGVLLYELLTGTTPFDKETLQKSGFDEMRRIIREVDPPRPSARVSTLNAEKLSTVSDKRKMDPRKLSQSLRGELDWIVMKALEKDRNRRYESASLFAADVERYLSDEPVQACSPSVWYLFSKFARRKKGVLAATGVVSLALLVAVGTIAGSFGWMARDREARQSRLAGQVELILDDVDRLMQEKKWSEALATAKRAEAVVQSGDADVATHQRVEQVLTDLTLVQRLEDARLLGSQVSEGKRNHSRADEAYARAFAEAGLTVEGVAVETAAASLRARPEIVTELATGLTDWSEQRRLLKKEGDASSWRELLALADAIDPDPWRQRLRSAWTTNAGAETLRELADSADLQSLPPSSIALLGWLMRDGVSPEAAANLLLKAQRHHPDDFWINIELADCLSHAPNRLDEASDVYRIALALRPANAAVYFSLGLNLKKQGKLEAAIARYRKAIELDPKFMIAHYNLGIALKEQGKLDAAIACYRRAIALDPEYFQAHNNLGLALSKQGKLEAAIACYRKTIELDPKHVKARSNLGNALSAQGDLDAAVACHRKAIELDPEYPNAHINLGGALVAQGDLDAAIACFRKAIELDPQYVAAHYNLGFVLKMQGNFDAAISSFRKATELDPKYIHAYHSLGLALKKRGKLNAAIASYRKAIELDPKFLIAHHNLGTALSARGDLDAAIACYRKAIKLDPEFTPAYKGLGIALIAQRKLDEAAACFRKTTELDPNNAVAHGNLGLLLKMQGKLEAAIASFRKAIELDPKDAGTHTNLGVILSDQGKLDAAIASYRKAIELDPKLLLAHNNLGVALKRQGKLDAAIVCYRKAIELDPKYVNAHSNLGRVLKMQGKLDEAIACYYKAIELEPKYADAHRNLGVARYRNGEWKACISALRKSMQLQEADDSTDRFFLAMAHWQLGEKDEARQWYDKAVEWMQEHDPDKEELQRFRAEAEELMGFAPQSGR